MNSPLNSASSQAAITNAINDISRDLKNKESVQVFKDDTGQRRVLLGKGKDDFYGLKVSQPGFDVFEASDDELAFNSNNNVFKVVASGELEIPAFTVVIPAGTANDGVASVTYTHDLGYIPSVMAFFAEGGTRSPIPATEVGITGPNDVSTFEVYPIVDDEILTIFAVFAAYSTAGTSITNSPITIKFYLFRETAN